MLVNGKINDSDELTTSNLILVRHDDMDKCSFSDTYLLGLYFVVGLFDESVQYSLCFPNQGYEKLMKKRRLWFLSFGVSNTSCPFSKERKREREHGKKNFSQCNIFSGIVEKLLVLVHFFFYKIPSLKTASFNLLLQRLDKQGVSFCSRTTYDDNAITNALEIYDSLRYDYLGFAEHDAFFSMEYRLTWKLFCRGGIRFIASNNDCGVREYDMERFQLLNHFRFPWPVNVSTP